MSVHAEWAGVEDCAINIVSARFNVDEFDYMNCEECEGTGTVRGVTDMDPREKCEACGGSGENEDADPERTTDGPSIVLGNDSLFVITAERPDQLVEFARTLLRMVEDAAK